MNDKFKKLKSKYIKRQRKNRYYAIMLEKYNTDEIIKNAEKEIKKALKKGENGVKIYHGKYRMKFHYKRIERHFTNLGFEVFHIHSLWQIGIYLPDLKNQRR